MCWTSRKQTTNTTSRHHHEKFPCASSNDIVSHARRTLVIRDIPSHGKAVAIHLDVPCLKCRPCNKTFTATMSEVDTGREMTMRLAQWIGRQSLGYTYAEIAKQVLVDEKTVRNVFDVRTI